MNLPPIIKLIFSGALLLAILSIYNSSIKAEDSTASIAINIQISDTTTVAKFDLNINNNNNNNVITKYQFPNIWQLTSVDSNTSTPNQGASSVDNNNFNIDFSSNPLSPHQNYVAHIALTGNTLVKSIQSIKELNLTTIQPTITNISQYTIQFPIAWGLPNYTNLKNTTCVFQTTDKISLICPGFVRIKLEWGTTVQGELKYHYNLADQNNDKQAIYLKTLGRDSTIQTLRYSNITNLESIYKDDSGNVFGAVSISGQNTAIENKLKFNIDTTSPKIEFKAPLIHYKIPTNLVGTENQLTSMLRNASNTTDQDYTEILNYLIKQVLVYYTLSPLDYQQFYISDEGITSNQKQLNYAQYLYILNQLLGKAGINNQIVLLDKLPFGGELNFILETCNSKCYYYKLDQQVADYETRKISGLGIQVAAFTGTNQLILQKIRNIDSLLPTSIQLTAQATSPVVDSRNIQISLAIPDQILNFHNFSATININNNSTEPIFLDELDVENSSFPIIDDKLAGLHKGVLPTKNETFTIDNVFLPIFFASDSKQELVNLNLIYEENYNQVTFNTKHSVILKQNYFFLGLLVIAIICFALTLFIIIFIFKNNKLFLISFYWRSRRNLGDKLWQFNQIKFVKRILKIKTKYE